MTIPAGIYSISVNINTYEAFNNWLTQKQNELFESLQLDSMIILFVIQILIYLR